MDLSAAVKHILTWRKYLTWRVVLTLGFGYLCLGIFSKLAKGLVRNDWIIVFDQSLANELYSRATPTSTLIFEGISMLGYQVVWVLIVVVALYFLFRRQWWDASLWLVGTASGELLNFAFKEFYARPRPLFDDPLVVAMNASFPSGHSMESLIVYGLLAYFLVANTGNLRLRILIIFATVLLVLLIGISRLYLGVHYFSDVLAGFAAGGFWLLVCVTALGFVHGRRRRRAILTST